MSRTATATNGALYVWDDGDNPGAGAKGTDVQESGTGLNANWETLDRLFTEHNTDGTHKADKITGANLKSNVADGTTLEYSGSSVRIKDSGVATAKIADLAVTTAKIANDAVDADKLKDDASVDANRAVTTNHIRDSAITAGKIGNDAVTSAKISHDNNRTKVAFQFGYDSVANGTWLKSPVVPNGTVDGIPMPKAGSVTNWSVYDDNAGTKLHSGGNVYGTDTFVAGDRIGWKITGSAASWTLSWYKNGTLIGSTNSPGDIGTMGLLVMLVEFDD